MPYMKHLVTFAGEISNGNGTPSFPPGKYMLCFSTRREKPTAAGLPTLLFCSVDDDLKAAGRVLTPGNTISITFTEPVLAVEYVDGQVQQVQRDGDGQEGGQEPVLDSVVVRLQFEIDPAEASGVACLLAGFSDYWKAQLAVKAGGADGPGETGDDKAVEGKEQEGAGAGNNGGGGDDEDEDGEGRVRTRFSLAPVKRPGVAPRIGQYSWSDARVSETLAGADAIHRVLQIASMSRSIRGSLSRGAWVSFQLREVISGLAADMAAKSGRDIPALDGLVFKPDGSVVKVDASAAAHGPHNNKGAAAAAAGAGAGESGAGGEGADADGKLEPAFPPATVELRKPLNVGMGKQLRGVQAAINSNASAAAGSGTPAARADGTASVQAQPASAPGAGSNSDDVSAAAGEQHQQRASNGTATGGASGIGSSSKGRGGGGASLNAVPQNGNSASNSNLSPRNLSSGRGRHLTSSSPFSASRGGLHGGRNGPASGGSFTSRAAAAQFAAPYRSGGDDGEHQYDDGGGTGSGAAAHDTMMAMAPPPPAVATPLSPQLFALSPQQAQQLQLEAMNRQQQMQLAALSQQRLQLAALMAGTAGVPPLQSSSQLNASHLSASGRGYDASAAAASDEYDGGNDIVGEQSISGYNAAAFAGGGGVAAAESSYASSPLPSPSSARSGHRGVYPTPYAPYVQHANASPGVSQYHHHQQQYGSSIGMQQQHYRQQQQPPLPPYPYPHGGGGQVHSPQAHHAMGAHAHQPQHRARHSNGTGDGNQQQCQQQ